MKKSSFLKLAGSAGVLLTLSREVTATKVDSLAKAELDAEIQNLVKSAELAGNGIESEVSSFINEQLE